MSCEHKESDFVESYGELLRCKCGMTMLDAVNDFRDRLAAAESKLAVAEEDLNAARGEWSRWQQEADDNARKLFDALEALARHARAGCPQAAEDLARIRGEKKEGCNCEPSDGGTFPGYIDPNCPGHNR